MTKAAQMSMQKIAGFLLSDDSVTDEVTETGGAEEIISVTGEVTETPEKRRRGRPPKAGGAMTAAERARRYRQKHRPAGQNRRVDLWASSVRRAEKLAAETGFSANEVIFFALGKLSDDKDFWKSLRTANGA